MCGIAGYSGTRILPPESISACLSLMGRRGPDNASFTHHASGTNRNTYLLHGRLSIIDLDVRANQPFRLGNHTIAFNGELYNYIEVRDELRKAGRLFHTSSDTEILCASIAEWGLDALDKCEGMWAFAVYDDSNGSLVLSRDRFGEKPLYLFSDSTGLYFGSEIKFIVALLGHSLSINYQHLYRYMVNGYKALYKKNDAFFDGLKELQPGSFLRVDCEGNEEQKRYWSFSFQPDSRISYQEAVEQTRELLVNSVKLRLRADVPLAFCMSGGVDSNALISIAKRIFNYDVHGFTIVNTDSRYEEQDMVDHAVKELGMRHTAIPVNTTDFLNRLRTLIRYHDAPVYTITYYAQWLLMESIAAHGYRISVSGTAADELFSGYYDHHAAYLYEARNDPPLLEKSLNAWNEHIKPIIRNPMLQDPKVFFGNPSFREHIYLDAKEFSSFLHKPWVETFYEENYCQDLLRKRMLNELFHESVPVILHEDDLNAMYYSVENRSPFLDRKLFEYTMNIPTRHLLRDGMAKAVLRDAMHGIAPDTIMTNRRKVGFNAPIFSFLDKNNPHVREQLLDDSTIYHLIHKDKIEGMLKNDDLPNSESKFLFYFLNAKMFLEEFAAAS